MRTPWLCQVNPGEGKQACSLRQLNDLKTALNSALTKRDWPQVCRIDRLSGQLINNISITDRHLMHEVLRQLLEIKNLYNQSLLMIEKELSDLSNQAF